MGSLNFDLTPREQEVLEHVARGLSNVEIAAELRITVGTVKSHLSSVFWKMGVSNRTEAAVVTYPSGTPPRAPAKGVNA